MLVDPYKGFDNKWCEFLLTRFFDHVLIHFSSLTLLFLSCIVVRAIHTFYTKANVQTEVVEQFSLGRSELYWAFVLNNA